MTELDDAFAAMEASSGDDAARLAYYAHLADAELCLLLSEEPSGAHLRPQHFDLEDGRFVLAFDGEERMATFVGEASAYAALPGRVVAGLLAGQGVGIIVNPGGPCSLMIPAAAVDWLTTLLAQGPDHVRARPRQILPPGHLPVPLLDALRTKLAQSGGLAQAAYLVGAIYEPARKAHLLAFVGADPSAEQALAQSANEALTFSGIEAGQMDVTFLQPGDPLAEVMRRQGLRMDLGLPPPAPNPKTPAPPGSDPAKPPILR